MILAYPARNVATNHEKAVRAQNPLYSSGAWERFPSFRLDFFSVDSMNRAAHVRTKFAVSAAGGPLVLSISHSVRTLAMPSMTMTERYRLSSVEGRSER